MPSFALIMDAEASSDDSDDYEQDHEIYVDDLSDTESEGWLASADILSVSTDDSLNE